MASKHKTALIVIGIVAVIAAVWWYEKKQSASASAIAGTVVSS
jgi:hypothetical protein